jgi:opacity protein-like surface antigen
MARASAEEQRISRVAPRGERTQDSAARWAEDGNQRHNGFVGGSMKRFVFAALAAALLTTAAASAQSYPGDPGAGVERGIEEVNNSGQVGTVTLFNAGLAAARVHVELHGTIPGRVQSVRIYRGKSCEDFNPGGPAYYLNDMKNGVSNSVVKLPEEKLLSGNYNVVVFSSNLAGARATACGHLYAAGG